MHLPPSIEGRNPLVGGGDAVRAARFAWLLASPGIGREENQQLRDGSLLPARTLRMGLRRWVARLARPPGQAPADRAQP